MGGTTGGTRTFYDTAYHFAEDAAAPDLPRLWRVLRHLEPLRDADFLDLGCGVGWAAMLARERGAVRRAVALDFSERALRLGRGRSQDVLWLQADGMRLPLADASVDRIVAFGSLEHFPDVPAALAEMYRVLAPNGRAVIVVPNFYVRTEQPVERRDHYFGWKRLLRDAGFHVTATRADHGPPVFGGGDLRSVLRRLAGRAACLVPGMQYQFVYVVRRR